MDNQCLQVNYLDEQEYIQHLQSSSFTQSLQNKFNHRIAKQALQQVNRQLEKYLDYKYFSQPELILKVWQEFHQQWSANYNRYNRYSRLLKEQDNLSLEQIKLNHQELLASALLALSVSLLSHVYITYAKYNKTLVKEDFTLEQVFKQLYVGYSGGLDSSILAFILTNLINLQNQLLNDTNHHEQLLYVDHGLAPDSILESWSNLTAYNAHLFRSLSAEITNLLSTSNSPTLISSIDKNSTYKNSVDKSSIYKKLSLKSLLDFNQFQAHQNTNVEAWARNWRYQVIAQHISNNLAPQKQSLAILLVGHHQDDNYEQYYLHQARSARSLIQGVGISPIVAYELTLANNQDFSLLINRPLLAYDRQQLKLIASLLGLTYVVDPMNFDESYTRVKFRNQLLNNIQAKAQIDQDKKQLILQATLQRNELIELLLKNNLLLSYGHPLQIPQILENNQYNLHKLINQHLFNNLALDSNLVNLTSWNNQDWNSQEFIAGLLVSQIRAKVEFSCLAINRQGLLDLSKDLPSEQIKALINCWLELTSNLRLNYQQLEAVFNSVVKASNTSAPVFEVRGSQLTSVYYSIVCHHGYLVVVKSKQSFLAKVNQQKLQTIDVQLSKINHHLHSCELNSSELVKLDTLNDNISYFILANKLVFIVSQQPLAVNFKNLPKQAQQLDKTHISFTKLESLVKQLEIDKELLNQLELLTFGQYVYFINDLNITSIDLVSNKQWSTQLANANVIHLYRSLMYKVGNKLHLKLVYR